MPSVVPPVRRDLGPMDECSPRAMALNIDKNAPKHLLMAPTKREILAASAGWVAVTLNVVPGLGAGYLYQRRWKVYWITSALATTWFVLGGVLGQGAEAAEEIQNQWIGLLGLVALAAGTAVEAGLAAKQSRQQN